MRQKDRELREAYLEFFSDWHWREPLAVTLTLKKVTAKGPNLFWGNEDHYQKNLRHFLNVLNRKVFRGRARMGKTIQVVPVLEKDQSGRIHYHLMLDVPEGVIWFWLKGQIEELWRKTDWGLPQVDVQLETQGFWLKYFLKFRSKEDYDLAIDWENVRRQ